MLHVKSWIHEVYIFLIQLFTQQLDGLAKALEMDNFPLPEEFNHVIYIRIIGKAKDIVVSDTSFLLWERIA